MKKKKELLLFLLNNASKRLWFHQMQPISEEEETQMRIKYAKEIWEKNKTRPYIDALCKEPLINMPLYINDIGIKGEVAQWRLKEGT